MYSPCDDVTLDLRCQYAQRLENQISIVPKPPDLAETESCLDGNFLAVLTGTIAKRMNPGNSLD